MGSVDRELVDMIRRATIRELAEKIYEDGKSHKPQYAASRAYWNNTLDELERALLEILGGE